MKRRKDVLLDGYSQGLINRRKVLQVLSGNGEAPPVYDFNEFDQYSDYEDVEDDSNDREIEMRELSETEEETSDENDTVAVEYNKLSFEENLLLFMYSSSKEYDSDKRIKRQLANERIRFGSKLTFKDVQNFRQRVRSKYSILVAYLCSKCENTLKSSTQICDKCNNQPSAHKEERVTTIVVSRVLPQLEASLKELVEWRRHHQSKLEKEVYEYEESKEIIEDNLISIPLMIYTDGVTPKQNFRHSFWPIFIQLGTLPAVLRGSSRHVTFAATIACSGIPSKKAWNIVLDRITSELRSIRLNPILLDGKSFVFDVRHLLMDVDALVKLFGSCGYQSVGRGCCLCLTLPRRKQHASMWTRTRDAPDRTHQSALDDAHNHQNGFDGLKPWHKIGDPTMWRIDALHVIDEGIISRMLNRFFKNKSPETLKSKVVLELNECYKKAAFPSNSTFYSRSLKEFNTFNGHEKRTLFFYIFPQLIILLYLEGNEEKLPVLTIFYIVIRWLASKRLNSEICEYIVSVLPVLGRAFEDIFGDDEFYQMKSHLFFVHIIKSLLKYGSPYDFSTAAFESFNREIKVRFDVHDTRSLPSSMILRWIYHKETISKIRILIDGESSLVFKNAVEEICGTTFKSSLLAASPKVDPSKARHSFFLVKIDSRMKFIKVQKHESDICTGVELSGQSLIDYMIEDQTLDDDMNQILNNLKSFGDFCFISNGEKEALTFCSNQIVAQCALLCFNDLQFIIVVDSRWSSK